MRSHGKHISPELTAYDSRGLVAYTRDGRLAATGRKMFHLYDALCRPAVSGLCEDFLSDSDWGRVHDIPAVERTFLSSGVASDYNFSPSSLPAAAQVTRLWYYDRYLPGMEYAHGEEAPLGLPTAERTLVLDGWTAADTVTVEHHYDSMMHEMFTRRKHSDGTMLQCTTTRTPGGLPLVEIIVLSGPLGSHSLTTFTEYDAFGRITSLKAIGDNSGVLTLAQNSYDGVGRLASSTVQGGTETTCGYDVRGALTSADNPFIKQEWKYASGSSNPSYAGRISAKSVEHKEDSLFVTKKYGYSYDSMGRLVEATLVKTGGSMTANAAPALDWGGDQPFRPKLDLYRNSESFTYDLNANMLSIKRYGLGKPDTHRLVDDLTMGYSGNRLTSLTDNAAEVTLESSMDIPSGWFSGRDFGYDAAGAVTRDVSRNIANIDYYFNGMPSLVGTMEGDCISYVYTADGEKLAETVWNGNRTTRRDYIGPFEFIGGQLLRINLPQGYIDSIGTLHAYIPDIQGNIVGVYEAREGNTELEQLNEYYAYGGLTADSDGQDANRRKHTAKELTTDFGINTYDFTARSQYSMASRFDQPDKKSGDYTWLSPYIFCAADPINFSDPTGMRIACLDSETHKWYELKNENGEWGFYNAKGEIYSGTNDFMTSLIAALNTIMTSPGGLEVVSDLVERKDDVRIRQSTDGTYINSLNNNIYWNHNSSTTMVPTVMGPQSNQTIALAHELAHAQYNLNGWPNDLWKEESAKAHKDVRISEIYTTHIENKIRSDLGLPLRSHYSIDETKTGGIGIELINPTTRASRLVDSNGLIYPSGLPKGIEPYIFKKPTRIRK